MAAESKAGSDDAGLRDLHQGRTTGDLGRHHDVGVDHQVWLPGRRSTTTCVRAGYFARTPRRRLIAAGLPAVAVDGEVVESNPPHRLVHTYRFLFNDAHKAEGFTRVTYEIARAATGFSRLTVTHELEGAPMMAAMVSSKFRRWAPVAGAGS